MVASALTAAFAPSVYYVTQIEPNAIGVTTYNIYSSHWPVVCNGFKIVQPSDVHHGSNVDNKKLPLLCGRINGLFPDMVFWTGDMTNFPGKGQWSSLSGEKTYPPTETGNIIKTNLNSRLLSFFCPGNHDNFAGASWNVDKALAGNGIHVLRNRAEQMTYNGKRIWIAGVEDDMTGRPDMNILTENMADDLIITGAHDPGTLWKFKAHDVVPDIILSGHIHGCQMFRDEIVKYGDKKFFDKDATSVLKWITEFKTAAPAKWFYGAVVEPNNHEDNKGKELGSGLIN